MAVQAQCSSNILLLHRTIQGKTQIENNYGGEGGGVSTAVFDHQSLNHNTYPFGNCSTNKGKRRREDNMNHFLSNQLIMDVSQIQSRNVDVSTGLRLAFNDHQQQQQRSIDPQSSGFVSLSSEDLSNIINQQGDEIQHFLQSHAQELGRNLAEKRQRHYNALIGSATETASRIIREKEAVAAKAVRRLAELEARATQLSAEAQVWQAKARAQEAVAAALQEQLQQAMVTGVGGCVSEEVVAGDAESSYIDPERVVVVSGPGCKACGKRVASVVLLPCRHLCVCSECDDVVQACPLCLTLRSSSIEVYMS